MLVLLAIGLLVTFDPEIFSLLRKVPLWPAYAVGVLLTLLAVIEVILLFAMPAVGIIRAVRAWHARRAPEPAELARAVVVRDRD